ncbi:MAG: hypothetical protein N2445_03285 [Acidobacteria bacterium]|nr:hypothetical protein [Acidobacteriota bacterium]
MTKNEKLFLILFLSAVFCTSLLQGMIDPDLFWHLRAGNDIINNQKINLPDSWNYLYEGNSWVNQQWLIEIIYAFLFNLGGLSLLFFFKSFVCSLIALFIFLSIKKENIFVSYLTTAITIAVIGRYFLMRTQLFSFLFLAILIYFLEKTEPHKRFLPLIFLFALWANIHAFFGLGLLSFGMYISFKILTDIYKSRSISPIFKTENLLQIANISLCALATLINPFGVKIYQTAGTIFSHKQDALISEWLPVWKYPLMSNMIFYIFFAILIFLSILFIDKLKLEQVATALPLVIFGFYSVRILPFSVVASAPLLSFLLTELYFFFKLQEEQTQKISPIFIAFLVMLSLSSFTYRLTHPIHIPDTVYREDYPVGAVAFMKENNLKGKIFNEFDWGGFLVFSSKDFKTAIDGRTAVLLFPNGYLEQWRDTVDVKQGWKERLEKGSPDYILLFSDDFLSSELMQQNEWQLLYGDSISVLFGRKK